MTLAATATEAQVQPIEGMAVLARIRELGPEIDRAAAASEQATEIDGGIVGKLVDSGALAIMLPREVGGSEAEPDVLIDVIREIAYWDGSTGWYAGAVMTAAAVSGAMLGDEAVAAIHGNGPAVAAGQAAPTGKAEKVDGGYRISGRYSFGSGCPAAEWLVGGYVVHENGQPTSRMLIGFAPRGSATFNGNWDVLGLRGTGSYDFTVREQVLPESFFFEPGVTPPRRGGALFRMGFMALPCLTHASFALGCARRALDELAAFARRKVRGPDTTESELPTFQRDVAVANAQLGAAEAYVRRTFAQLYAHAQAGTSDDRLRLDGRLCAIHALATGLKVAELANYRATTAALRNGSPIQRCFRDLTAGNAHFLTGEGALIEAGKVLAGIDGAPIVF